MLESFYIKAYPKINTALKIGKKLGKLHTIESRFNLVLNDIYDEMLFCFYNSNDININNISNSLQSAYKLYKESKQLIDSIYFYLYGNFDCNLESNLIYSAYKTLYTYSIENNLQININRNVSLFIFVNKKIPVGGGLGGGSVNAAITLLILNKILGFNYNLEIILECAKKLGSDITFFIMMYNQNSNTINPYFMESIKLETNNIMDIFKMYMKNNYILDTLRLPITKKNYTLKYTSANVFGIGDIIELFSEKQINFLIHCNKISCNTSNVYKEFARINKYDNKQKIDFTKTSNELLTQHNIIELNDLYIPACNLYNLKEIESRLCKTYGKVYFSGSGSSFFSIENKIH